MKVNFASFNRYVIVICILMMSVTSIHALAQQPQSVHHPDIKQLAELVKQKQFQAAYDRSTELIEEWGGDPAFDFLAGRAAFGIQRFQEAVFAFERVMVVTPKMLSARVYLAFSYFRVNNYGAAQKELTKLLKEDLPEKDAAQVRDYLEQITAIKDASVRKHDTKLSIGYGHDSNVNSGTSAETIIFPIIGEIELLDSSRETADEVAELALTYSYTEKLSQKSHYSLGAAISDVSHQTEQQLDRTILNLSGGYVTDFNGTKVSINSYVQPMALNDKYYRLALGSLVDATWALNENWQWMLGVGFAYIDNDITNDQDIRQYSAKSRFTYLGDQLHMVELGIGDDEAVQESGAQNGKDFWQINYNFIYPINPEWMLTLTATYQDIEHDAIQPSFQVIRKEESYIAGLNVDYTPVRAWRFSLRLNMSDKKSNIDIYDYDRGSAKVLVTHTFE
jgi:tetratricopeptide (TPR) repeat protein